MKKLLLLSILPFMLAACGGDAPADADDSKDGVVPNGEYQALNADKTLISYGLYPQTVVTNETIIGKLNALVQSEAETNENGWYLLDGIYYAKAGASYQMEDHNFNNGEPIIPSTDYWFKCQSVKWHYLYEQENHVKVYICANILTCTVWDYSRNLYSGSSLQTWQSQYFKPSLFLGISMSHLGEFNYTQNGKSGRTELCIPTDTVLENAEYGFTNNDSRIGLPTDYYSVLVTKHSASDKNKYWAIKASDGIYAQVNANGSISRNIYAIGSSYYKGVRPLIGIRENVE